MRLVPQVLLQLKLWLFQRVAAENIWRISHNIKTVVSKLNNFTRTVALHTSSTLRLVNEALVKIKQLVKNDVDAMENMVHSYKEAYETFLGVKIDHVINFLESADDYLGHLAVRSESGPWTFALNVAPIGNRGSKDYGWVPLTQAIGVFDVLRVSLLSVTDINTMVPIADLDESARKVLPSNLWASKDQWRFCNQKFTREASAYRGLIIRLYKALYNWQESNKAAGWPDNFQITITRRKRNVKHLKVCAEEYRDIITKTLGDISSFKSEVALNTGTGFDFKAFADSLIEDLKSISVSGSWLYQQLRRYREHTISKLQLAQTLLGANSQDDIVRYMETVLFKIDLSAIFKLETESQRVKTNIQKWYAAGLGVISSLLGYVERDEVESKMRNLSIWRKPVVDLRTPEVLKYSYSFEETWRTWPASVPLPNLVTPDGSQYISNILEGYMNGIGEALYAVQRTSQASKEEAVTQFGVLWEDLQSYVRQSQIDDRFIR